MSLRSNGSYIGPRPTGPTNGIAGVASGIWDLRSAQRQRAAGAWPFAFSSPTQITGLQLWLDASDADTLYDATTGGSLVASDGTVKRWEDKSGNNRHATEATNGPQRKTAIQGGQDVLRFDGSNDKLSIPSSTAAFKFLHSQDSTVFVVGKPGTTANPDAVHVFIDNNGRSNAVGLSLWYDDRASQTRNDMPIVYVANGSSGVLQNADAVSGDKFPANVFSVISVTLSPSAATASRVSLRKNGAASFGSNALTGTLSTADAAGDLFIGSNKNAGEFLNGDIAEIIMYDSALSDTDREAVENYLLAKWAIT